MVAKLDSETLRMCSRVAFVTTSKLIVFLKRPSPPSPNGQPDASGGGSHLPKSESNGCTLAVGQPRSASLHRRAGGEAPHSLCVSVLLCTLGVGAQGASTPLGRGRKGKLSHLPGSCGDGRREWPTVESGGAGSSKEQSTQSPFWRQQGRFHPPWQSLCSRSTAYANT